MKVWGFDTSFQASEKTFCMWLVGLFIATAQDYLESKNIEFVFKNSGVSPVLHLKLSAKRHVRN